MPTLKPGTRLRSAVCSTEVMVIQAPAAEVEVTCGETPMLTLGASPPAPSEARGLPGASPQGAKGAAQRGEAERSSSGRATAQQPTALVASEATRPPGSSPQASEASAQRAEGERSSSGRAAAQQPTERSQQTRISSATNSPAAPDQQPSSGTLIGKRYVNPAGDLELLCTKPGAGALAADGVPLAVKGAKPLPSSD